MVSSQLQRGHILKFGNHQVSEGRQGGIETHPLFPKGQALGCSSPLFPAEGAHSTITAGQALGFQDHQMKVVVFFLIMKRTWGPSCLLGTLEGSSPTCLTPSSLLPASKGGAGEKHLPSQGSCPASLFPPSWRQLGRWEGAAEKAGQEGREKRFFKLGKKENVKDLTPNLSLFKNKRFFPQSEEIRNKSSVHAFSTAGLILRRLLTLRPVAREAGRKRQ